MITFRKFSLKKVAKGHSEVLSLHYHPKGVLNFAAEYFSHPTAAAKGPSFICAKHSEGGICTKKGHRKRHPTQIKSVHFIN